MNTSEPRRDTWFAEEIILARFLDSLDSSDQLAFPVRVEHRDQLSPDFVLYSPNAQIGLEITCFTDEERIRAHDIILRSPAKTFFDVTGLKDTGRRRSNEEVTNTMSDLESGWETEDGALDHKIAKIAQAVERKRKKFQSQDYEKFRENWLLIYDNYSRFASCDGVEYFRDKLSNSLLQSTHEFERLYIFCYEFSYRWHERKLTCRRV